MKIEGINVSHEVFKIEEPHIYPWRFKLHIDSVVISFGGIVNCFETKEEAIERALEKEEAVHNGEIKGVIMNEAVIANEGKWIIPSQTRTVHITDRVKIFKYKLKLPELCVHKINKNWFVYAYQNGVKYHLPLPNIFENGEVCLPENVDVTNLQEFLTIFYGSAFDISFAPTVEKTVKYKKFIDYIGIEKLFQMYAEFFNNWQEHQNPQLVKWNSK